MWKIAETTNADDMPFNLREEEYNTITINVSGHYQEKFSYDLFNGSLADWLTDSLTDWLDGMRIGWCCYNVYTHFVAAWLNCMEHVTVLFPICKARTFGISCFTPRESKCQFSNLVSKFWECMNVCVCRQVIFPEWVRYKFCRYTFARKSN